MQHQMKYTLNPERKVIEMTQKHMFVMSLMTVVFFVLLMGHVGVQIDSLSFSQENQELFERFPSVTARDMDHRTCVKAPVLVRDSIHSLVKDIAETSPSDSRGTEHWERAIKEVLAINDSATDSELTCFVKGLGFSHLSIHTTKGNLICRIAGREQVNESLRTLPFSVNGCTYAVMVYSMAKRTQKPLDFPEKSLSEKILEKIVSARELVGFRGFLVIFVFGTIIAMFVIGGFLRSLNYWVKLLSA